MEFLTENIPGKKLKIGAIPAYITKNHNEAYYFWEKAGLRYSALLHIDGHDDMGGCYPKTKIENPEDYYKILGIANFICPAVHYGIIDSVYWLNPHSDSKKFQFLGSINHEDMILRTVLNKEEGKLYWYSKYQFDKLREFGGKVIEVKDFLVPNRQPLILDIDLDAFCTDQLIANPPQTKFFKYNGVKGFEKRIKETGKVLKNIKKPDLITITRSEGGNDSNEYFELRRVFPYSRCYVPKNLIDKVEQDALLMLHNVYG